MIKELGDELDELLQKNHLDRALRKILEFSSHFNQYFQHKEPWKNEHGTNSCVFLSVNVVRSIAIAIYPFLPTNALSDYGYSIILLQWRVVIDLVDIE